MKFVQAWSVLIGIKRHLTSVMCQPECSQSAECITAKDKLQGNVRGLKILQRNIHECKGKCKCR